MEFPDEKEREKKEKKKKMGLTMRMRRNGSLINNNVSVRSHYYLIQCQREVMELEKLAMHYYKNKTIAKNKQHFIFPWIFCTRETKELNE